MCLCNVLKSNKIYIALLYGLGYHHSMHSKNYSHEGSQLHFSEKKYYVAIHEVSKLPCIFNSNALMSLALLHCLVFFLTPTWPV